MFLLRRIQEASLQSRIVIALCLTPGLPVRTLMIMSSASCVEWCLMAMRETSLWKPGPALFVCCDTSNMMVVWMGTMISNSAGALVGQHWKSVGGAHWMTIRTPPFFSSVVQSCGCRVYLVCWMIQLSNRVGSS